VLGLVAVVGLVGMAGVALVALSVWRGRGFEPTEQPRIVFPAFVPPAEAPVIEPAPVPPVDVTGQYAFAPLEIGGGGYVTGLEIHSSGTMVARTDVGGAFLYDDAASRWQPLMEFDRVADPDPGDHQVESIAIAPSDPDRLYIAVGETFTDPRGRVLVSTDGGATFTSGEQRFAIAGNAEWRTGGERLSVDPADADVVWLGTRTEGLWRSVDGGMTFTAVEGIPDGTEWRPDLNPTGITFVLASDGAVDVGVAGSGVWRSTDDGATWVQLWETTGLPYDAEIDAAGRLWVAEPDDGRVQRFDPVSGEVTTLQPSGEGQFAAVATDPSDPDLVVIGPREVPEGRSMWRSVDGGESWDTVDVDVRCDSASWLEAYGSGFLSVASMEFDPLVADRLWFPEGFGVWRADDVRSGALAFECDTLGIEELVANEIVVTAAGTPVSASWDRAFFGHLPGGPAAAVHGPSDRFNSAWSLATTAALPERVYGVVGDHRFCCEADGEAYWAGWTDDAGVTWQRFGSFDGDHPRDLRFGNLAVSATDPNVILWLPSFDRPLHRSVDGGASWQEVVMPGAEERFDEQGRRLGGSHFAHFLDRQVLVADPVEGETFYLFHTEFGLMATTDAGVTWEQRSGDGLALGSARAFNARLEAVPGRSGHLLFTPGPVDGISFPMYESRDGGRTWAPVAGTADVVAIGFGAAIESGGPPVVFVAGTVDGVRGLYRSTDDLAGWEFLSPAPNGNYGRITTVAGDPTVPGVVYVGFDGSGYAVGTPIP
jgi:photosystem II stability/assembly factor-like uncharacterized protein